MKLFAAAALALALAAASTSAMAQDYIPVESYDDYRFDEPVIIDALQEGYWVIVASIDIDDPNAMAAARRIEDRVAHCGVRTFNDFSHKFDGFREGYDVHVTGVYETKGEAQAARNAVARCVPDAYVKWAAYYD